MPKPEIWAVLGSRGSGKSAWVSQALAKLKPRRLAIWDLMREHQADVCTDHLPAAIRAMGEKRFSVAFQPSGVPKLRAWQFDLWCRALTAAGDCTALVEELSFVTRAGTAPEAWSSCTLLGRHRGLSIIGTTQRPAHVDKDFLGNADLVHAGRQTHEADARCVGTIMGVDYREVMGLPDLHWIERRAGATECTRGVLTFGAPSGRKPQARKLKPSE